MGKKAKFNFVRTIKGKEEECMRGLWRTGVMTREQLEKHFEIKGQRLTNLENSKYLTVNEEKVQLGEKGEQLMKSQGLEFQYVSSFKTFQHDYRLSQVYLDLDKDIRETWVTEKELHHIAEQSPKWSEFKARMEDMHSKDRCQATPDAAIQDREGKWIGIDIVTNNYKDEDIEQKEAFCNEFLDDSYIL